MTIALRLSTDQLRELIDRAPDENYMIVQAEDGTWVDIHPYMSPPPIKYRTHGWHAHSFGGTAWLARYEKGEQIEMLHTPKGNLRRFRTIESAKREAARLNKRDYPGS